MFSIKNSYKQDKIGDYKWNSKPPVVTSCSVFQKIFTSWLNRGNGRWLSEILDSEQIPQ